MEKSFREQFRECLENGTGALTDEMKEYLPFLGPPISGKVYWCKKRDRQCSAFVCREERGFPVVKKTSGG